MTNAEHEHEIDVSPIEIAEFQCENETLRPNPPLKFQVEYEHEESVYTLEGDFDMSLYAFSRQELESMLIEVLQFWWVELALACDSKLEPIARRKKKEMLARIKRA